MALARRHVLPALKEPEYEVNDVPRAHYTGRNSAAQFVSSRDEWLAMLGEMVLVSNRAEEDFERKLLAANELVLHPGKPLSLEYLADRVDTDDPMWGYTIRTQAEGWLQGYITLTTFTTWLKWFRFDSLCEAAGVLPYSPIQQMDAKSQAWWDERVMDGDGRLARALNRQIRDGDWTDEGVIWHRVAEISLLAGLGCGGLLLDAALEELYNKRDGNGDAQYEYVVVQATENAVPFYESRGFVRVGAIARYEERKVVTTTPQEQQATATTPAASAGKRHKGKQEEEEEEDEEELTGTWSPCFEERAREGDTARRMAARFTGVRASDIVFLNRRMFGPEFNEDSILIAGTSMRIPSLSTFDQKLSKSKRLVPVSPLRLQVGQLKDLCTPNSSDREEDESSGMWYSTQHESIPQIARKFKVSAQELVAHNRGRYPDLKADSNLHPGSTLLIPGRMVDLNKIYSLAATGKQHEARDVEMERRKEEIALAKEEAKSAALREFYCATVTANSTSAEGVLTKPLSEVMAYRHWTFPDELVSLTTPSYMMAMPLSKEYLDKHIPSFASGGEGGKSALAQLQEMSLREYTKPPFNYYTSPEHAAAAAAAAQAEEEDAAKRQQSLKEEQEKQVESMMEEEYDFSRTEIRVSIRAKVIEKWRMPIGQKEDGDGKTVYCRGAPRTTRLPATLSQPLKPRPPLLPILPVNTPMKEYTRQVRPDVMRQNPTMSAGDAVKVCETTWKLLGEEERRVYVELVHESRQRHQARLRQYHAELARFHARYGLDETLYDVSLPEGPRLRSTLPQPAATPTGSKRASKNTAAAAAAELNGVQQMLSVGALGPGYRKLMNKVVTLRPKANERARQEWLLARNTTASSQNDLPPPPAPAPELYYTLTYIPDLQWCRLVPLKRAGVFEPGAVKRKKYENHVGRTKWMLVAENEGGEIDVGAERCTPVFKAYATKNVQDANKEEWDVYLVDPNKYPTTCDQPPPPSNTQE